MRLLINTRILQQQYIRYNRIFIMSNKDSKINGRRNLQQIRGAVKNKNLTCKMDKENIIDFFKKQKSKSNQKNHTLNTQCSFKVPFMKKSNNKINQNAQLYETKKIKTQDTALLPKKQDLNKKDKQDFNMTMVAKKSEEKYNIKKQGQNSYFLTADISTVLRALNNNNLNLKADSIPKNKKVNMMTEEDIQKLFQKDYGSNKKKKDSDRESERKDIKKERKLREDVKKRGDESSNEKQLKKLLFHTDPNHQTPFHQRKIQTMKVNIKKIMDCNSDGSFIINKQNKDFAESIKFLEISQQPNDKLLSALNNEGFVKIEADPDIDKTAKFKEQFVVGKQIGQGAYASVRVAIYKPENKRVAIKIYEKKKIKQIQRRKSVKRQIKILQIIDHKNILKIYDVIQTNNHVNIIMEYISGISLNTFLKSQSQNRISQKDAKKIFIPLTQAIKYLHSLSICHRDIKLENILLDSKLSPKLIDFGFSTCISNDKRIKMFCGTPSYMAPQIVLKKQYKGTCADIWALGVLLYVMFTGIFPFKGHTDKQLYTKISNADYPKLYGVSKGAENLIQRMLTIDPQQRINSQQILQHFWITGNQEKCSDIKQSSKLNQNTNQYHQKLQILLKIANQRNQKNKINQLRYDQSKQRIGLAQTYKQNILRQQLKNARQQNWSPKNSKPRTCTNRDSYKIKLQEQFEKIQKKSKQRSTPKQHNGKLLQFLKLQLKKKVTEQSNQKYEKITKTQQHFREEKLTNKRYF